MDKAEIENQIAGIIFKYRLKGSMTDNRIAKIIIDNIVDKYAQQVSRERTFDFLRRFFGILPDDKTVNTAYDKFYH